MGVELPAVGLDEAAEGVLVAVPRGAEEVLLGGCGWGSDEFSGLGRSQWYMMPRVSKRLVHLELHTGDLEAARALFGGLFGWPSERVGTGAGAYQAIEMGGGVGGGIVECPTERPLWLPYIEVPNVELATQCATERGARVLLEPREGPVGWRSVVTSPVGGELAFWQPKR